MDRGLWLLDASRTSRVAAFPQGIGLETITRATPEIGARFARVRSMVEHDHRQAGRSTYCRNPYGRLSPEVPRKVRYGPRLFLLIVPARTGGRKPGLEKADGDLRATSARG